MGKMKWLLFAFPALFAFTKNEGRDKTQRAITLLTEREWVLIGYGIDKNDNGMLDEPENEILDCERDNTYRFSTNGKGAWFDNSISCGNGVVEMLFHWEINAKSATLCIQQESKQLFLLDSQQLILCEKNIEKKGGQIMVFKH